MQHYDSSYFCEKGKGPRVTLEKFPPHEDGLGWPITIRLNPTGCRVGNPSITIYVKDEEDLMTFVYSVNTAMQALKEEEGHVLE